MLNLELLRRDARQDWIVILIAIILLILYSYNPANDYYLGKWALFCAMGSLFLAWKVGQKTSWLFAIVFGYLLLSPMAVSLFRWGPYAYAKNSILFEPLKAWVYLVCLSLVFLFLDPKVMARAIRLLVPANIFYCIVGICFQGFNEPLGFDDNLSVNATLMALMLPFCMTWWTALLTLAIVIGCKASMGLFATIAAISTYYFVKSKNKLLYLAVSFSIIFISFFLFDVFYGEELFNPRGRLSTWKAIFILIEHEGREWLGFGIGTFSHIMPSMELLMPDLTPGHTAMLWAHNDYLQHLFEAGYVGCVLTGLCVVELVVKAWRHPMLLSFTAAFLVSCVGNFPSHLASSSLLLVVTISLIYYKGNLNEKI